MKFDFIIGNPPYQDETLGDNEAYSPQIYNQFMDESYKIADAVELIHPGRFLFNAGSTPKAWNQKMLSDPHFKVLFYEPDTQRIFPNQQIPGGIAITYRNPKMNVAPIGVFTVFSELNTIKNKVIEKPGFESFSQQVYSAYSYHFTDELHKDYPHICSRLSKGHAYDLKSNVFDKLPDVFLPEETQVDYEVVSFLGLSNATRTHRIINKRYVSGPTNFDKFKIVLARADGAAGTIGKPIPARVIGNAVIEWPNTGTTESFLNIGSFDDKETCENALKYVKSKFMRALVSVAKATQDITPEKWKFVPMQDFSNSSDIDWSKTIHEIDQQLYAKYGLDADEVVFIETYVKEMI